MPTEERRRRIDLNLAKGAVPSSAPRQTLGGTNDKTRPCSGCDDPINKGETVLQTLGADDVERFYHPECGLYIASKRLQVTN